MIIKKKKRLFLGITFLVGVLSLAFVVHNVLPYAIISRQPGPIKSTPTNFDLQAERTTFTTRDSLELTGYWVFPKETQPRAIMILMHGIGGGKEHFYPLAKSLSEQGIACIVYDARAHGESQGEHITYGYYEKHDVSDIVKIAKTKFPELPIGVWGNSMGGAVALQALEIESAIDFGVIESTFTNLTDIVSDYQKRYTLGIRLRWISDYALERAGEIAQFDPRKVSPLASTKNIKQPIFIAHGTADPNIPFEYGKQLSENLKNKDKVFYPVEGANHYNLSEVGGKAYYTAIGRFIKKQYQ